MLPSQTIKDRSRVPRSRGAERIEEGGAVLTLTGGFDELGQRPSQFGRVQQIGTQPDGCRQVGQQPGHAPPGFRRLEGRGE